MFLQIMGVLFLIVICVVAYYFFKVYRYVKKQENSDISVAISVLPAMEMELVPSNVREWKEIDQLNYVESELKKIGASHVGYYCVYHGFAIIKISLWNYKDRAVVAIYEGSSEIDKNNVSFIYEISCKLTGGSICITTNQHAVYENRPDNHKIVFMESSSVLDMLKAVKPELPSGKKIQRIGDPKDYFIECYEDISEWGWRPEQILSEKTQQLLSSVGVNINKDILNQLVEIGTTYSINMNVNRSRRALAKQSKMSADQWEKIRDKLVFINENMQTGHLVEAVYELAGELSDVQEKALEGFQINTDKLIDPIGAFQLLIQSLNLNVKRVTSMDVPVRTEVYLPL